MGGEMKRKGTGEQGEASYQRGELRCECGNLLARLTEEGVELKCRRCKRIVVIPFTGMPGREKRRSPPRGEADI
jgi:phage FluMu protein Com